MSKALTISRIALCAAGFVAGAFAAQISSLAPGDSVLSIHGVCPDERTVPLKPTDCTVAVSRQQFEDLMSVLAPGGKAAPGVKDRVAKAYAELLTFDRAARDYGFDKSPQYQITMRWLEAKTLADVFRRQLEKDWGLGQRLFFLHDGRTSDLTEAILDHAGALGGCYVAVTNQIFTVSFPLNNNATAHFTPTSAAQSCGSEADDVVRQFKRLSAPDQQDLLNFLRSL